MHCNTVQSPVDYRFHISGMCCGNCGKVQPNLSRDDWREGYIGKGANGVVTPLPCCPGWEAEVQPEPAKQNVLRGQKSLFDDD